MSINMTRVEVSNPVPMPTVEVTSGVADPIPVVEIASTGATGRPGTAGTSAYELAVEQGYVGTQLDWIASLHGPGFIVLPPGETVPPPGTPVNTIVFQDRTA